MKLNDPNGPIFPQLVPAEFAHQLPLGGVGVALNPSLVAINSVLSPCLDAVLKWMRKNKLKWNPGGSEATLAGNVNVLQGNHMPIRDRDKLSFYQSGEDLGIIFFTYLFVAPEVSDPGLQEPRLSGLTHTCWAEPEGSHSAISQVATLGTAA